MKNMWCIFRFIKTCIHKYALRNIQQQPGIQNYYYLCPAVRVQCTVYVSIEHTYKVDFLDLDVYIIRIDVYFATMCMCVCEEDLGACALTPSTLLFQW